MRTAALCSSVGPNWLSIQLSRDHQRGVRAHLHPSRRFTSPSPPLPTRLRHRIVKPWNLGRSLDTVVTRSLGQVAAASLSGPKICQRYIHDPLLVGGRKFDLRFLLLVESFAPAPKAALWDEFFVRIANHAYTDTSVSLGDFQTHFTSMRQRGFEEQEMSASEFREIINREAGRPTAWAGMMDGVRGLLRELLAAAAPHVAGGRPFPRGRALYGVDVMFTSDRAPKLLEVTFCPGVERPMAADPEFINKARTDTGKGREGRRGACCECCCCVTLSPDCVPHAGSLFTRPVLRATAAFIWRLSTGVRCTVQRRDRGGHEPFLRWQERR